jgi:phosphoglucosamine mutase
LPRGLRLDGLKVVVDCAHGAAHRAAPEILWELGADVVPIGVSPNGININEGCGSTHPHAAAETVVAHGAHLGICLDGDADRVILVDETGVVADGDQLMALLATRWADDERLAGGTLVSTVMSNLGLERYLEGRGLKLERTGVGDRYVVERMREGGFNLGGEQSGHIVMIDYATTGDGLMAGLHFLAEMVRTGDTASALARRFDPVPQLLMNVRYRAGDAPLDAPDVRKAITEAEAALAGRGRLLIRKSGTEPVIRVMGECEDQSLLRSTVEELVNAMSGVRTD